LRRELSRGYRRLAQVQGMTGQANLGDSDAARRSLEQAVTLLEPIARSAGAPPRDRIELADVYVHLADFDRRGHTPTEGYDQARNLLDGLSAADRATIPALQVEQGFWFGLANMYIQQQKYRAAQDAYANEVRAAEAVFRLSPENMDASRNLSLGYKQFGAILEFLDNPDEAIVRYQRAMALDRARVEREPRRTLWRLDLSFAIASMGSALQHKGDLPGALAQYRQAVDLRRGVVAEDPDDDFAQVSLARGYARLGLISGGMGDVPAAIDWHAKRLDVLRLRAAAHLDRAGAWNDYRAAAVESIGESENLLESGPLPAAARRTAAGRIRAMIEQFRTLEARRPAGAAAPKQQEIARLETRLAAISR
jgi:tetratricopeptide (TPR) repeat protein